ncbi:SH3 domain-containing protein C23A1.17-like [Helianthus annuus]|uniref:SH3 domain-containing protein C23A1.17-like n=1 Tax=Helianthus annuus TaxID=4232 RepID=UPI001652C7FE|nr:SH3 domain-containing protein C23A1.17-like [Helianthus annuus]
MTGVNPTTVRHAIELSTTLIESQVRKGKLTRKGDKKKSAVSEKDKKKGKGKGKEGETTKKSRKRKDAQNFAVTTQIDQNSPAQPPAKKVYAGTAPHCARCDGHHVAQQAYTMASSDSGVSNTIDPMAITSDDEIATDPEVYTSDTTSTDEDDFHLFALPVFGDDLPLADGPPGEELPLVPIPAPLPFAAVPFEEQPLDALPDGDIDLLIEGPPEGDQDGGAPMEDDVPLVDIPVVDPVVPMVEIPAVDALVVPPVEAPIEEALPDPSVSYPFESASSATIHAQDVQHYSTDIDSDMAMSAAPIAFHDFDSEHEVEFLPNEPVPADPELGVAPEPIFAPDPIPVDAPVVAPPVTNAPVIAPPAAEIPDVAPIPDPMPIFDDFAPFATHIDPRYADTRNGWIEDDDDYPPFVLPVTPPAAPISAPVDVPPFSPTCI